jgi:hypothetical protein
MKSTIRKMRNVLGHIYYGLIWLTHEFRLLIKHLGSSANEKTKEKFKARLIIQGHIVEKGLSFRNVKIGFGEDKIFDLLDNLWRYYFMYSDVRLATYILVIVKEYINFNKAKGHQNTKIIEKYEKLYTLINPNLSLFNGGIKKISKKQIYDKSLIDFESFVNMRFSIRDFTDEPVDIDLVRKAIKIAGKTPSACNRQPWRVHLFVSKERVNEILDYQTGARQFKENIGCAILVTCSYNNFFGGEYHQPYVNGALYAMTLIYALHSLGFGTIALNMGFPYNKLVKLSELIDIKNDEVPVLLIGVGHIPDQLNVACSERFNYQDIIKEY